MLSETKLKSLKPQEKVYKVVDRDGLYVTVAKSGLATFRFDYRINSRRETLIIGKYWIIGLVEARAKLMEAKKLLAEGISPAIAKQQKKELTKAANFAEWLERWFKDVNYEDSTRDIVEGIIKRDVLPKFGKKILTEISADMLRKHCESIKERGAPVSAVRTRDIVSMVFTYAKARGVKADNPAEYVAASTIATFSPRDRALSKREIGIFFNTPHHARTSHALKVALKIIMLTMVRKSAIVGATWDEIDFKTGGMVDSCLTDESQQTRRGTSAYRLFITSGAGFVYATAYSGEWLAICAAKLWTVAIWHSVKKFD